MFGGMFMMVFAFVFLFVLLALIIGASALLIYFLIEESKKKK